MSIYYTDSINWRSIAQTENGEESGDPKLVKCRIEDTNKLIAGDNGKTVKANALIFLSSQYKIKKGDIVQISKIRGNIPIETGQEYQVRQIMNNAGFGIGEWEVYI